MQRQTAIRFCEYKRLLAGVFLAIALIPAGLSAEFPDPLTLPKGYQLEDPANSDAVELPWFLAPSPLENPWEQTQPAALFPPPSPAQDGFVPVQQRQGAEKQNDQSGPSAHVGEAGDKKDDDKEDDEKSLEERVEDIETKIEKIHHDLDGYVIPGTKNSTMKIVGRIHIDAWGFPGDSPAVNVFETGDPEITPQNRFGFRRIRFGVRGDVWKTMEYRIETEISSAGDFEWRDVWLGFNDVCFADAFLIGNQKRPFGLDHLNSSRFNIFIERPFIVEALNEDARRLGVQNYWFTEDLRYNMRAGLFLLQKIQDDDGNYVSDNLQGQMAGRFATTFLWEDDGRIYGHFAVSGAMAEPDGRSGGNPPNGIGTGPAANEGRLFTRPESRTQNRWLDTGRIRGANVWSILGLEHAFNYGPVQIVSEFMVSTIDRNSFAVPEGRDAELLMHGGYIYAAYFLTGEHMPWDRESGTLGRIEPERPLYKVEPGCECDPSTGLGAWQIALRYSYADLTDEDVFGGEGDAVTLGLVWYWNANANVQFNYGWGSISERNVTRTGVVYEGGNYEFAGIRGRIDF